MDTKNIKKNDGAKKKPSFKSYCQRNMSNYDFNRLDEATSLSKHMITKMLNNPEKMTLKVLEVIATILNLSPHDLAVTHGCGLDGMTAREYRQLLEPPKAEN